MTTIGHCLSNPNKCCHPSETQIHKKIDRTGKKCTYYRNTNEIPYQVSFRVKTYYPLHAWKIQRYHGYITNLAFVRPVFEPWETYFSAVVGLLRSLVKYFQHSWRTFVSPRDNLMPSVCMYVYIYTLFYQSHLPLYFTFLFTFSLGDLSQLHG